MTTDTKHPTLLDDYKVARERGLNSAKWYDIEMNLALLIEQYSAKARGPWLVVNTAFHGGGIVSRHYSALRALERMRGERVGDCVCGCVDVVQESEYDTLPNAHDARSPYAAAR
jgi:hypothetical protein